MLGLKANTSRLVPGTSRILGLIFASMFLVSNSRQQDPALHDRVRPSEELKPVLSSRRKHWVYRAKINLVNYPWIVKNDLVLCFKNGRLLLVDVNKA